jgi:voltage-gated potassium channel
MPLVISTLRALRTLRDDAQFKALAFLAMVAMVSGTVFYWLVEGLRLLDSFYFSVMTLTTVGYGDFSPETDVGKLFTAFYALTGIGIMLTFVTRVAGQAVVSHADQKAARHARKHPDEVAEPIDRRRAA